MDPLQGLYAAAFPHKMLTTASHSLIEGSAEGRNITDGYESRQEMLWARYGGGGMGMYSMTAPYCTHDPGIFER